MRIVSFTRLSGSRVCLPQPASLRCRPHRPPPQLTQRPLSSRHQPSWPSGRKPLPSYVEVCRASSPADLCVISMLCLSVPMQRSTVRWISAWLVCSAGERESFVWLHRSAIHSRHRVCACACSCTCAFACVCVCVCVRMRAYASAWCGRMRVRVRARVRVCMHVRVRVCMHVRVRVFYVCACACVLCVCVCVRLRRRSRSRTLREIHARSPQERQKQESIVKSLSYLESDSNQHKRIHRS